MIYINSFISVNKCLMIKNLNNLITFKVRYYIPAFVKRYKQINQNQITNPVASNISHRKKTIDRVLLEVLVYPTWCKGGQVDVFSSIRWKYTMDGYY